MRCETRLGCSGSECIVRGLGSQSTWTRNRMEPRGLGEAGGGGETLVVESSGMVRAWGKLLGLESLRFQNPVKL